MVGNLLWQESEFVNQTFLGDSEMDIQEIIELLNDDSTHLVTCLDR